MSAISEQLEEIAQIKSDIKDAIIAKGQVVGNKFDDYAQAILDIQTNTKEDKVLEEWDVAIDVNIIIPTPIEEWTVT